MEYNNEKEMYPDIIESIKYYMDFYGYPCKIFKTWQEFENELYEKYQKEFDILGNLGKPDIMVIYTDDMQKKKL